MLSTIHSAKGLEWDVVHVIHAADGMIPSDMATGDDDEIEEERRLLYVAMTRARDALHVYRPMRYYRRPKGDPHSYSQLSRFLEPSGVRATFDEIGPPSTRATTTWSTSPERPTSTPTSRASGPSSRDRSR